MAPVRSVLYTGGNELINRLDEVTARPDYFIPYLSTVTVIIALGSLATFLVNPPGLTGLLVLVALMLLALAAGVPIKRWSEQRGTVQLVYDLHRPDIEQRLACANTLGAYLSEMERLWKMSARTTAAEEASEVPLPRLAARCLRSAPRNLTLNLEIWGVVAGPQRVFFLPDCILLEQESKLQALAYDDLIVEASIVRHAEWEAPALDTRVLEEQWRFVQDGSEHPDEVKHVSICEYGELSISHPSGWLMVLQASNGKAMHQAARALQELVRAARAESGKPDPKRAEEAQEQRPNVLLSSADSAKGLVRPPGPTSDAMPCASCKYFNPLTARYCAGCGSLFSALATSTVLRGRYVILGTLSLHAVGTSYRVWDTTRQKAWVVKEVPLPGRSEKERQDAGVRAVAEGQMLSAIDHPGLPTVIETFNDNGCQYLVAELVEGESLSALLEREGSPGLDEARACALADQLLEMLMLLHQQTPPLMYCGLHPGAVVVSPTERDGTAAPLPGRVRLIDLGHGRALRGGPISVPPEAVGYCPPEVEAGHADLRSDLYSVGAILHQLLTGRSPAREPVFEVVRALAPHVSERVDAVISKALQVDPKDRPESAASMRAMLCGGDAGPPDGKADEGPEQTRGIVVKTELLHRFVTNGMCHSVCFSPDGSQFMTGCYDVRLWDVETRTEVKQKESVRVANSCALISADGLMIAFGGIDGSVHLQEVKGAQKVRLLSGHTDQVASLAFSTSGDVLASASLDGTVRLWDGVTGTHLQTLSAPGHLPRALAFSPDGTRLASAFGDLAVWNVGDGTLLQRLSPQTLGGVTIRALAYSPDGRYLACACSDSRVMLLDPHTFAKVRLLTGHEKQVLTLAWAPVGWLLATGAADGRVRLWDVDYGTDMGVLEGHGSAVASVAFTSDGRRIASGSWDLTARMWDVRFENVSPEPSSATRQTTR